MGPCVGQWSEKVPRALTHCENCRHVFQEQVNWRVNRAWLKEDPAEGEERECIEGQMDEQLEAGEKKAGREASNHEM